MMPTSRESSSNLSNSPLSIHNDDYIEPSNDSKIENNPSNNNNNNDTSGDDKVDSDSSTDNDDDDDDDSTDSDDDDDDDDDDDELFITRGLEQSIEVVEEYFSTKKFSDLIQKLYSEGYTGIQHQDDEKSISSHYQLFSYILNYVIKQYQLGNLPHKIYLNIFLPIFSRQVEFSLQPNHILYHSEITFQLFLRYLDQDLNVDIARGQFQSYSMRRTLFSSLEDTYMPSYPELSSAIHFFLDRYSNFTPQRLAFNTPPYNSFGLWLQDRYRLPDIGSGCTGLNRDKRNLDGEQSPNNDQKDEKNSQNSLEIDQGSSLNLNPDIPKQPTHITKQTSQWPLYYPLTPILIQQQNAANLNQNGQNNGQNGQNNHQNNGQNGDHQNLNGHDNFDDDSTSSDDDPGLIDNDENINQNERYHRSIIRHRRYIERQRRRRIRWAQRMGLNDLDSVNSFMQELKNDVIYTKTVIPRYDSRQIDDIYCGLVEMIRDMHKDIIKIDNDKIIEKNQKINLNQNEKNEEEKDKEEKDKEENEEKNDKNDDISLQHSNTIQQSILYQLFIVPYPLCSNVHLTMSRESWLQSLRFTLGNLNFFNIFFIFQKFHFLNNFIQSGTISLLKLQSSSSSPIPLSNNKSNNNNNSNDNENDNGGGSIIPDSTHTSTRTTTATAPTASGWGYNHNEDLGLLDLTYVNCMARDWITFDDLKGNEEEIHDDDDNDDDDDDAGNHGENGPNFQNEEGHQESQTQLHQTHQQQQTHRYKVLVDNGSELIENVILGVIESLLEYS